MVVSAVNNQGPLDCSLCDTSLKVLIRPTIHCWLFSGRMAWTLFGKRSVLSHIYMKMLRQEAKQQKRTEYAGINSNIKYIQSFQVTQL